MDERRRYKRQVLVMYLHVFAQDSGKVLGYLGDITPHGLMLIGEQPVPVGHGLALGIRLHKLDADLYYVNSAEEAHLACHAESRWNKPLGNGLHATGLMLTGLAEDAARAIEDLIERIGRDDLPQRDTHTFVDTLLHFGAAIGPVARQGIGAFLSRQHGVVSVALEDDTPHLAVVQYHRERTDPERILAALAEQGIGARTVNC